MTRTPSTNVTGITLHYNESCPDCARQAARTARLDWFGRIAPSTEHSPLGEVPVGEIVVVDRRRKRLFTGVFATRRICMEVPLLLPLGLLLYLSSSIAAAFKSPAEVRRRMRAYRSRKSAVVMRVCTFAAREYREQITAERERALGEDSEWAEKREAIRRAADGASRAVAHWHERTRQEPGSRLVKERSDAASGLSRKLTVALATLDEHAEAVGRAYDECRGTVDAMERRIEDVEQIRELGALSDAAEGGQALACASVKEIAETLLEEAESVGAALADLSRRELETALGGAGDNIEQLAEDVAGESEQVRTAITDLDRASKTQPSPIDEPLAPLERLPEPVRKAPIEALEATPRHEVNRSAKPRPIPTETIAHAKRRVIDSRAALRERQLQLRAKLGWGPPETTIDPETGAIDNLDLMPENQGEAQTRVRSTSPERPARLSEAEEERQMKELVDHLRTLAEVQRRKAHDLRYPDEFDWEADDRDELAEKMTDLADEIEMFYRLRDKMKAMES